MDSNKGVLAAARAIRPYLADLVGPNSTMLDQQIADLLMSAIMKLSGEGRAAIT